MWQRAEQSPEETTAIRIEVPASRKKWLVRMIAVTVAVVVPLASFGLLYNSATVLVTVNSDHFLFTVEIRVEGEGALLHHGTLGPGQAITVRYSPAWLGMGCRDFLVSAFSTGGGFGDRSQTALVGVCRGDTRAVTLTI